MRLRFLGATGTVTGSKYLVETPGARVMVDCGLFQGFKALRLRNWGELPVPARDIDAVILTHAHIDHSGYLPLLVRNGFRGRVVCSPATLDLCRIMLPDFGRLQEEDARYLNRHKLSRHDPALPLYTAEEAVKCLGLFSPARVGEPCEVAPGLHARFTRSGHIAGSTFVRLDDGSCSILFSGDLGRPADQVPREPGAIRAADYVVVESTYGDRDLPATDHFTRLADVVNRTVERKGVVLIPAFAMGRAQSLAWCLLALQCERRIPDLPVYLNSPMATLAMESYLAHAEELRLSPRECAQLVASVRVVESREASERLNYAPEPMVVIAGNAMATGGRVLHHLKAFAPHDRNTIVLAGYQAGGTRGAAIAEGAASVRIHGQDVPVRAEVVQLDDMSAHADRGEILQWLRTLGAAPRRTFITHGEPAASDALRQKIERELGWECQVPCYLEAVELAAGA